MVPSTFRSRNPREILTAIVLSGLWLSLPAAAGAQQIEIGAERQISALLAEKASRTPAQTKIDSHLLHAAMVVSGQPLDPALPSLAGAVKAVGADASNAVEVDIRAGVTDDLLAAIRAAGGRVVNSFPAYESVRAVVPLARLENIAARAEVRQIRAAEGWHTNGPLGLNNRTAMAARSQAVRERLASYLNRPAMSIAGLLPALNTALFPGQTNAAQGVDTWGDTAMAAAAFRTNFGFDGTGIKVGVLSDGVDSMAAEKIAGRLPTSAAAITVNGNAQAGAGDEGTAMLEIVYSLAPGANLYFATATGSSVQMAANIRALRDTYNCDVIVDDVSYFTEAVFQDGAVAQAVNEVASKGVLYFSSAGNSGNVLNGASGTWQGDFTDSNMAISAVTAKESQLSKSISVKIHSFDNGATNYNVLTTLSQSSWADSKGQHQGHYELKWSDPLGKSNNDYDLFILDKNMSQVLDSSTSVQSGTQDPEEYIDDNSNLSSCTSASPCRVVIAKDAAAAVRTLHLDTERGVLAQGTHGATFGHNATSGALTVAATDARAACYSPESRCASFTLANIQSWAVRFATPAVGGVERYSSDGPRLLYYDAGGSALTPNKFTIAASGGQTLNKPDLTAADCVPTGVSGFTTFCGTSSAAPHAAAVAALMLQAKPTMTAANITAAGNMLAVSGSTAWNETSGMGVLMADKFINTLCAYSASAPSVAAAGGTYSLAIGANAGCNWTVNNVPSWITMPTKSGTGAAATLGFTVAANNTGASRTATLAVPGSTVTITQGAVGAAALAISTTGMISGFVGGSYTQALAATGGSQPYTWSTSAGSLPPGLALSTAGVVSGSPTTVGAYSFTVQVKDSVNATATQALSIVVAAGPTGGAFTRIGAIAHLAAGASWDSELWVVNSSSTATVPIRVKFYADDGSAGLKDASLNAASVPYTATVNGVQLSSGALGTYVDFVLPPNSTGILRTSNASAGAESHGWAEVLSNSGASLTGFCVFRSTSLGEGISPLQTQLAQKNLLMPFDNSVASGIALDNIGAVAANVKVTAWDQNGTVIPGVSALSLLTNWAAGAHTAFMLGSQIAPTAGQKGLIQFTIDGGGALSGIGLRVGAIGSLTTFTSIPVTLQ